MVVIALPWSWPGPACRWTGSGKHSPFNFPYGLVLPAIIVWGPDKQGARGNSGVEAAEKEAIPTLGHPRGGFCKKLAEPPFRRNNRGGTNR